MPKVLIVYYSRSQNTKKMAELISEGIKKKKWRQRSRMLKMWIAMIY